MAVLEQYNLTPNEYFILVARMEPENNIKMAIEGYLASDQSGKRPLIVVGKTNTDHGYFLTHKYESFKNVRFVGGIFDFQKLNSLRYYSLAYFHGHSVGGTNPSLLEAMASSCFILSHNNVFNKTVLNDNALYYNNKNEVTSILNRIDDLVLSYKEEFVNRNLDVIRNEYSWEKLIDEHEKYFKDILHSSAFSNSI